MGILNSSLSDQLLKADPFSKKNTFPHIRLHWLKSFPLYSINFIAKDEKILHDSLVSLVDVMLNLNKKIQTAKGNEKEQVQRQIEKTDREIDEIVYKLYGITEGERKIIESKG